MANKHTARLEHCVQCLHGLEEFELYLARESCAALHTDRLLPEQLLLSRIVVPTECTDVWRASSHQSYSRLSSQ